MQVGRYTVDVFSDETFRRGSADNIHQYDFLYLNDDDYQCNTTLGIKVFEREKLVTSAVIGAAGGDTGVHKTAVVYENARIVVCCADSIFCLSIPELSLLWQTQADDATCFEIYKYKDSYIVHGELAISRLDKDGQILWQQSGADIFTTIDGEDSFALKEDHIIARDFEGRVYKFNYDGKSLSQ